MIGILDTHAFIWWDSEPARLSPTVLAFLLNPGNTILLSVRSVWEMLIKQQLGKLTLRLPLKQILDQQQSNGIELLPVGCGHVLEVGNLPAVHKDPFDRLLAAQARVEGAVLVSADAILRSLSGSCVVVSRQIPQFPMPPAIVSHALQDSRFGCWAIGVPALSLIHI